MSAKSTAFSARKVGGKPKAHKEFRGVYFRGGNAPASLKHGDDELNDDFILGFPGWKRPGLIEA